MKTIAVILKALKEQMRSFWVMVLTLSMGPFFILVYYLIIQASDPVYKIIIVNLDKGFIKNGEYVNHGKALTEFQKVLETDTLPIPFKVTLSDDPAISREKLRNKEADAMVVIHPSFSEAITRQFYFSVPGSGNGRNDSLTTRGPHRSQGGDIPQIEFIGDLTSTGYLISAVWENEIINEFALRATQRSGILKIKETPLGNSSR